LRQGYYFVNTFLRFQRCTHVTLAWKGGGYDHVWVDDSGRGQFSGSGTILEVQVAGEKIPVYQEVNGSTTFVARSDRSH